VLIIIEVAAGLEPADRSVGTHGAEFSSIFPVIRHGLLYERLCGRQVIGVDPVCPGLIGRRNLPGFVAQHTVMGLVPDDLSALYVPVPGRHLCGGKSKTQSLLLLPQCLLDLLLKRDVGRDTDNALQCAVSCEESPAGFTQHHYTVVACDPVFGGVRVAGWGQVIDGLHETGAVIRVDTLKKGLTGIKQGRVSGKIEDRLATRGAHHLVTIRSPLEGKGVTHIQRLLDPLFTGVDFVLALTQFDGHGIECHR